MCLPHELFSAIFLYYPRVFDGLFYGGEDNCRRFWNAVKKSEHWRLPSSLSL